MCSKDFNTIQRRYLSIRESKIVCAIKIQDEIISAIRDFLRSKGFIEILAPIIGPVTDPGIRGAKQVSIDYYGTEFKIMSSMILYKQMAIASLGKVFALSPNIRIEPLETVKTRRHLTEFRQVDLEEARVKRNRKKELQTLGRKLRVPKIPFKRYTYEEAVETLRSMGFKMNYGEEIPWNMEEAISAIHEEPFWITGYPVTARGFYYLEQPENPGLLKDFDLLYPEGYGEAVSGGEREYRYEKVVKRMRDRGEDPLKYSWYLEMLKEGVPPSAGFGIGVERLTRYICGMRNIWDVVPFPKIAGVISP